MPKMVYIGPGTGKNEKEISVRSSEVASLEKTGLWKQKSKSKEADEATKERKDK